MKLSNSKKYKKDLTTFTKAVESISDKKRKVYYQKLLSEFINQVQIIDEVHNSFNSGLIQPHAVNDNIKQLAEIRYQLTQLSKDIKC